MKAREFLVGLITLGLIGCIVVGSVSATGISNPVRVNAGQTFSYTYSMGTVTAKINMRVISIGNSDVLVNFRYVSDSLIIRNSSSSSGNGTQIDTALCLEIFGGDIHPYPMVAIDGNFYHVPLFFYPTLGNNFSIQNFEVYNGSVNYFFNVTARWDSNGVVLDQCISSNQLPAPVNMTRVDVSTPNPSNGSGVSGGINGFSTDCLLISIVTAAISVMIVEKKKENITH